VCVQRDHGLHWEDELGKGRTDGEAEGRDGSRGDGLRREPDVESGAGARGAGAGAGKTKRGYWDSWERPAPGATNRTPERSAPQLKLLRAQRAWEAHRDLWARFHTSPPALIRTDDVPWLPDTRDGLDWEDCELLVALDVDVGALSKVWHPDKFSQRFGQRLHPSHQERVLRRVTVCSQLVNQARDAMRTGGVSARPASRAGPPPAPGAGNPSGAAPSP